MHNLRLVRGMQDLGWCPVSCCNLGQYDLCWTWATLIFAFATQHPKIHAFFKWSQMKSNEPYHRCWRAPRLGTSLWSTGGCAAEGAGGTRCTGKRSPPWDLSTGKSIISVIPSQQGLESASFKLHFCPCCWCLTQERIWARGRYWLGGSTCIQGPLLLCNHAVHTTGHNVAPTCLCY